MRKFWEAQIMYGEKELWCGECEFSDMCTGIECYQKKKRESVALAKGKIGFGNIVECGRV